MNKRERRKVAKKLIYLFYGISSLLTIFSSSELMWSSEKSNQALSINENKAKSNLIELEPMPKGDIDFSSKQVDFNRNPFKKISDAHKSNLDDINLKIDLKGISYSKNKVMAIIETNDEQRFYKVGEKMSNGFLIKEISIEDETVDITNGIKDYRLILSAIQNSL